VRSTRCRAARRVGRPGRRPLSATFAAARGADEDAADWLERYGASDNVARPSQGQWPTLRLVRLPVHASWLNQVEIYFLIVQRKVVSPNDFTDLAEIEARLLAFERRYQQTAAPFDWRFTRSDLDWLLRRLDDHEPLAQEA
jgi:hypothetical protein